MERSRASIVLEAAPLGREGLTAGLAQVLADRLALALVVQEDQEARAFEPCDGLDHEVGPVVREAGPVTLHAAGDLRARGLPRGHRGRERVGGQRGIHGLLAGEGLDAIPKRRLELLGSWAFGPPSSFSILGFSARGALTLGGFTTGGFTSAGGAGAGGAGVVSFIALSDSDFDSEGNAAALALSLSHLAFAALDWRSTSD